MTPTDDDIRAFGDQANANGDHHLVLLAARALAVPPVSWEAAWQMRDDARRAVGREIANRTGALP